MTIFCNFYTTSSHFHPLQVENRGSNSRLVVDEDDNGKFGFQRVKGLERRIYQRRVSLIQREQSIQRFRISSLHIIHCGLTASFVKLVLCSCIIQHDLTQLVYMAISTLYDEQVIMNTSCKYH